MKQVTKKDLDKKKPFNRDLGHWEGKYWCNCRVRNYRKWLGVKKYGHEEIKNAPTEEGAPSEK